MAIMNFALLALVPFVLARPQVGHGDSHKAFHAPRQLGSGLPGPFSRTGSAGLPIASGTAPFPVPGGNSTSGAATGSSGVPLSTGTGGPVYITSVISVIPTPIYSDVTNSAAASAATGGAGASGAGNSGSGSQQTRAGGVGGSGAGTACGPATVTITNANTVTVTVTPAGGAGQSSANGAAGASSQIAAVSSSVVLPPVSSAPFPIGNSTAPAGTGTGTAVSGALTSSVAAVQITSSSSSYVAPVTPPSSAVAAVQITSSSSYVAPVTPPSSSVAAVQATSSSVPAAQPYQSAAEKYKPQQIQSPAPPAYTPSAPAPAGPPPAPASSAPASSAPVASPSSTASKPATGGAKGLSYNTAAQVASVSGLAWACNWGQTVGVPNPNFEYVPQLWGKKPGMADSIKSNCAGAKACIFYNEPDKSLDVGGSGVDVGTAISDFTSIMKPIQAAGSKVSTPCVANSDNDYMSTFLAAFPSGSIDIMCFHWYGNDVEGLKGTVSTFSALAKQYGIKELWINEWAVQPAPADLSAFTSYLDGAVTRYAYNANDLAGSTGY